MPRPRRPTRPLDDAGRALAERWLPFARQRARSYGRRCPWLADEYESACLYILCDAAAAYPSSAAAAKGLAFSTYLGWRLRGARREVAEAAAPPGYRGKGPADVPPATVSLAGLDWLVADRSDPGPALEAAEAFAALVDRAPPEHRAALVDRYGGTGSADGPYRPGARQRERRALVALRGQLAR